jgi:hypothetical protein
MIDLPQIQLGNPRTPPMSEIYWTIMLRRQET